MSTANKQEQLSQNIKAVNLFVSKSHFLIKSSVKETRFKSNLMIERKTGRAFEEFSY